jgi:hypothetical protein
VFARLSGLALIALVLAIPVAAIANPTWAASVGLDVWNVPALQEQNAVADERNRNLEDANQELHSRIDVKEGLIRNLIAGRTTLAAVRDQFLILDQDRPDYMFVIRQNKPGATDEEAMTHNVIGYTLIRLDGLSALEKLAVIARLDAEFRRMTPNRPDSAGNENQGLSENPR